MPVAASPSPLVTRDTRATACSAWAISEEAIEHGGRHGSAAAPACVCNCMPAPTHTKSCRAGWLAGSAGPLLLLNLALYVSMMGFASWALNSFVDDIGDQEYYPPAGAAPATLHFIQFALLAAVLGSASKAAAAFHARASWRPQGLAAAAALGTVAWAATALALDLACKEMRAACWQ
ncbi:uncharacterized protein LOC101758635 [Setaria italica]|uniref:uncharacterized protein LOC101758635 n=1 Tax=Setaria italica TaxID=4555 RepID=UPI000350EDB7|nr:uncharacterized protein LOC101758635 [Setaria italica]